MTTLWKCFLFFFSFKQRRVWNVDHLQSQGSIHRSKQEEDLHPTCIWGQTHVTFNPKVLLIVWLTLPWTQSQRLRSWASQQVILTEKASFSKSNHNLATRQATLTWRHFLNLAYHLESILFYAQTHNYNPLWHKWPLCENAFYFFFLLNREGCEMWIIFSPKAPFSGPSRRRIFIQLAVEERPKWPFIQKSFWLFGSLYHGPKVSAFAVELRNR